MDAARVANRQNVCLPNLFYGLQHRHLGRSGNAIPAGSAQDRRALQRLVDDHGAAFTEIREVICWLWLHPEGEYWRGELSNVAGFCNAYVKLCERFDSSAPPWWLSSPAANTSSPFHGASEAPTRLEARTPPPPEAYEAALAKGGFVADFAEAEYASLPANEAREAARANLKFVRDPSEPTTRDAS